MGRTIFVSVRCAHVLCACACGDVFELAVIEQIELDIHYRFFIASELHAFRMGEEGLEDVPIC